MVNFTKSISNEQMTIGLKRLLDLNTQLAAYCNELGREQDDSRTRDQLAELASQHQRNVETLKDSLLFLGGAPDKYQRANRRSRFPGPGGQGGFGDGSGLSGLRHREEKLREACLEELRELNASDEVVNAVNHILDETEAAMRRFDADPS